MSGYGESSEGVQGGSPEPIRVLQPEPIKVQQPEERQGDLLAMLTADVCTSTNIALGLDAATRLKRFVVVGHLPMCR